MSDLQLYSKAFVFVDGRPLQEEGWLQIRRTAERLFISISSAVPEKGFEFDAGPLIKAKKAVSLTFFAGAKALKTSGHVTQDELRRGVSESVVYTFSIEGGFAEWMDPTEEQQKMLLDGFPLEASRTGAVPVQTAKGFAGMTPGDSKKKEKKAPKPKEGGEES